jgi:hypothetical protein
MATVNSNGVARFGVREWFGIVASMIAVATLTSGVNYAIINSHIGDSQIHQTAEQKTAMVYGITDREMTHHVDAGPHAGVTAAMSEINSRLTRIETLLENMDR